jgi:hypothetical protein
VNILFFCSLTEHVSGALAPTIRSTGNCIYSHKYRVYTDKMEVVEGKTFKSITLNLKLPHASVAESVVSSDSATLTGDSYRFNVIFLKGLPSTTSFVSV